MMKLQVVVASTRPGRAGLPVARWFVEAARRHGRFDVELVDLLEWNLPHLDEPKHPRFRDYQHEHTRRWSAKIDAADAFVFVTPEYNYSAPPALLNALDFLYWEWNYKPLGFVSYGGVSGGLRSVQVVKLGATTLKLVAIPEAVSIPWIAKRIENGAFAAQDVDEKAATTMLDELHRWADALTPLRRPAKV
jgi:NAD(P)H-dependent FMN reductase